MKKKIWKGSGHGESTYETAIPGKRTPEHPCEEVRKESQKKVDFARYNCTGISAMVKARNRRNQLVQRQAVK